MSLNISKLEAGRQEGKNQADDRRLAILDAAEQLFLDRGLENIGMSDIAAAAGISRVSLYRYFPDRDPIVFEVAARMLRKIAETAGDLESSSTPIPIRDFMLAMIDRFYELRDAYRFIGMFNHLYGDHYPNEILADWFREQAFSTVPYRSELRREDLRGERAQIAVIFNTIMSFLEKMAGRGDLMASEQGVPVVQQLSIFRGIIEAYLDHLHFHV